MTRRHGAFFTGLHAAQEARKDARGGDHQYATQAGTRFASVAEFVDTDARIAPQSTFLELRTLAFTLPMPPSVNALYGQGHNGAKFLLPDQRHFRSAVIGIVRADMRGTVDRVEPLAGRLEMRVTLFYANRRRTDTSNRLKSLEDALTHAGAYLDDSQIDRHIVERLIRPGEESCEVMLREIAA